MTLATVYTSAIHRSQNTVLRSVLYVFIKTQKNLKILFPLCDFSILFFKINYKPGPSKRAQIHFIIQKRKRSKKLLKLTISPIEPIIKKILRINLTPSEFRNKFLSKDEDLCEL
jgi:hypothetical protein